MESAAEGQDIRWNSQLETILSTEAERCLCLSVLHRLCESRYSGLNNYIAIPCIVLSTIAGASSIGSTSLFPDPHIASISIGLVSIGVGILNTIGSYFSWARRAEGHKSSSLQYSKLHRFLMIELALPRHSRMVAKDLLKTMRDQIDRLNETSYMIPSLIIEEFKKKYDGHTDVSRPEIANGLDPVIVYRGKGDGDFTPSTSPVQAFTLSAVAPTLPPVKEATHVEEGNAAASRTEEQNGSGVGS